MLDNVLNLLENYAWNNKINEFFDLLDFHKLKIVSSSSVYDGSFSPQYTELLLVSQANIEYRIYVPWGIKLEREQKISIDDFF